jgi:ubiquinone/menaquinone biosynthesis C-methylase UbiE
MLHGDFTELAKKYINRPAYNSHLLDFISKSVLRQKSDPISLAEVGAGTGKLTKMLLEMDFTVSAVEPNDSMRNEGIKYTKDYEINWSKGTGEETGLQSNQYDWAIMASSFHWTDPKLSLPEFHRILKPNKYFTIIWNPRDIKSSNLHLEIEEIIYDNIPDLKRKSSGGRSQTEKWEKILTETGHFKNVVYSEISFFEKIAKEKYMGAWESVNDIRVQSGEEKFRYILSLIEKKIEKLDFIEVPYKNTSWSAQKID